MKDTVVRARIGAGLKEQAAEVLAACGLELSDAIRLFLQQVVVHGGVPFRIRNHKNVRSVSGERLRRMKRAAQARDGALAVHRDLSAGEMLLIRPDEVRGAKVRWPSVKLSD